MITKTCMTDIGSQVIFIIIQILQVERGTFFLLGCDFTRPSISLDDIDPCDCMF